MKISRATLPSARVNSTSPMGQIPACTPLSTSATSSVPTTSFTAFGSFTGTDLRFPPTVYEIFTDLAEAKSGADFSPPHTGVNTARRTPKPNALMATLLNHVTDVRNTRPGPPRCKVPHLNPGRLPVARRHRPRGTPA